jgi:pyruvate dehydrogenase E1 component
VQADVWSVTSYNQLRRDALATERWNRLHPAEPEKRPHILTALEGAEGPIVAASDYMKVVPDQLSPWLTGRLVTLGTDGFGRSDNREHLRRHFEVNAESIACAALSRLARDGKFDVEKARAAFEELGVSTEKVDPAGA